MKLQTIDSIADTIKMVFSEERPVAAGKAVKI
jgi:hypothetical protein